MANCKYPGCNKTLVGKEKYICKSCKDKVISGAKTGAKWIGGAAATAFAIVVSVSNRKD